MVETFLSETIFSRLFLALFELLLDSDSEPDSDPLELPLELFFFLCLLKPLNGELGFFRFGADIGDGPFFIVGTFDRVMSECRLFCDELRDFGRSILLDTGWTLSFER